MVSLSDATFDSTGCNNDNSPLPKSAKTSAKFNLVFDLSFQYRFVVSYLS